MVKEKIQLTDDGFNEVYEAQTKIHSTYRAAYEAAEASHEAIFGRRRYSDYKSFETIRNRKINK